MSGETFDDRLASEYADAAGSLGLSPLIEPLVDLAVVMGPLGAQLLRLVSPLANGVVVNGAIGRTASLLEHPRLAEVLRQRLARPGPGAC